MFRKIFIGSYITIFLLCILSKFLLNTDIFLIYFIVTIIMVSLLVNEIKGYIGRYIPLFHSQFFIRTVNC